MSQLRHDLESALGPAYRIEREVREVGACRLFIASDQIRGGEFLVRLLPRELSAEIDPESFERRVLFASSLIHDHPAVVRTEGAGKVGAFVYLVRPFVPGTTLAASIQRDGALPLHRTVRYLRDVLEALAHAHERGVLHGDVRPENVLLADGRAMVADFGVLDAVAVAAPALLRSRISETLGAAAYLAPERAAGDPRADHRADLYSAGAVAYEMLVGERRDEPVRRRRASVPVALGGVVMRCLAEHPDERWQEAADIIEKLDTLTLGL